VGSQINIMDDSAPDVRGAFFFEAVSKSHPHYWSFLVLREMIGNWSVYRSGDFYACSPLAEILATENIAFYYETFYKAYLNTGLFGVLLKSGEETSDDAIYETFHVFQKLATYFPKNDLIRAKNQLKSKILLQYENQESTALAIGTSLLGTGRSISALEQFNRIDAVESEDIYKVLNTYLTDVDPAVAAHGLLEEFPDYNVLRSWTYWNRW